MLTVGLGLMKVKLFLKAFEWNIWITIKKIKPWFLKKTHVYIEVLKETT